MSVIKPSKARSDVRSLDVNVESLLTRDRQFIVAEYKAMLYFMALFFLALVAYGVYDAWSRNFRNIDYQSYVLALAIIPFVFTLRRIRGNRVYIRINATGIYQDEYLVTRWENLLNVTLTQEEKNKIYETSDKFILLIDYRKEGQPKPLRRKIPLTNTQNKSEEEVLAAVKWFWVRYRSGVS